MAMSKLNQDAHVHPNDPQKGLGLPAAKTASDIFLLQTGTRLRAAFLRFASHHVPVAERKGCSTHVGAMPGSHGLKETPKALRFFEEEDEEEEEGRQ